MSTSNQRQSVITKRKPNSKDRSIPSPKALKKTLPTLHLTFSKKKIVAHEEIDIIDDEIIDIDIQQHKLDWDKIKSRFCIV